MAIANVQSTELVSNGVTSTTLAYGSNITAGNLLVVTTHSFSSAVNLHTDNNSNTYRQGADVTSGLNSCRTDYAPNANSGATTVTIDPTGTADIHTVISEWSGADVGAPFDSVASGTASGTSAAPSAGATGTLSMADSMVYASVSHAGTNQAITEDTGDSFTMLQENEGGSSDCPGAVQYKVVSATTSVTPDFTTGASQAWITNRLVFRGTNAYPYHVGVGTFSAEASTTSLGPVAIPTGATTDDILICALMLNAAGTFTGPGGGWTQFGTAVNSANQSSDWYWKRHDGSESDPTFTTSVTMSSTIGGYARIHAFRRCITSGDPFVDVTMAGSASETTPDSSAIDTTEDESLAVCFCLVDDDPAFSSGNPPSGWALAGANASSTTGGDALFSTIMKEVPTAGAVSAVVVGTLPGSDFWRTLTCAFLPEAGGGDGTATPGVIALSATLPSATVTGAGNITPATIARSVTMPTPVAGGHGTPTPDVIARSVTLPAPTVTGAGNVAPAVTALSATLPAVTTQAGATASPDVIARSVTIPAPTITGAGNVTPTTIAATVVMPAATASGGGAATATPGVIAATVTLPAPTPQAGTAVTPATITATVTIPAAVTQAGATTSPTVIPLAVTIPAATASGGSTGTATPNVIATITTLPAPTLTYGYQVSPAVIALAVAMGAATATGLVPAGHPVTLTLRGVGHTITITEAGHTTTHRERGHTATARERR